MRNIKKLVLSIVSVGLLASCGNNLLPSDSVTIGDSVTSDSSSVGGSDSTSTSEPNPVNPEKLLEEALQKDYSNATIQTLQSYDKGESTELDTIYHYNGYYCVYSEALKAAESSNPYLYYHDYQNKNYMYFAPDKANPNPVEAWLDKGAKGEDLSLGNAYFSFNKFIKSIDKTTVRYSSGLYLISDPAAVQALNSSAFAFAWFNDIQYVAFQIDENGYLYNIMGLEEIDNDKEYVKIVAGNIGTTTFSEALLPTAPNDENVMEFWEYKGWDGPYEEKYIKTLTLTPDASAKKDGETVVLEIEEALTVRSSYLPLDANEKTITWHSTDSSIVAVESNFETGARNIVGVKAGTAKIYAVAQGPLGDDKGVKSNEITVRVNPLKEQNIADAIYNLSFTGINNETLFAGATNAVKNDLPYSVSVSKKVSLISGINNLWESTRNVMLLDSGNNGIGDASVIFDFDDQQVSSLSMYYAMYYNDIANIDYMNKIAIETSNDGTTWIEKDIKKEIKDNISNKNLKLLELEFEPASMVKIVVDSNFSGKHFRFAFDEVAFMANKKCHDHVDTPEVIDVTKVEISLEKTDFRIGKKFSCQSIVTPNNATNATLSWHSNDETAFDIDELGVFTCLKEGKFNIYAESVNGIKSNEVAVTVLPKPAVVDALIGTYTGKDDDLNDVVVEITKESLIYNNDTVLALDDMANNFTIFKDDKGNFANVKLDSSSSDKNSLSITSSVNGHTINKNYTHEGLKRYVAATKIILSAKKTELLVGENVAVKAQFTPTNATGENAISLVWTSSNPIIASVDEESGYVTAKAVGSTTIKAINNDGISGEIEITVRNPILVDSIILSAENDKTTLEVSEEINILASIGPAAADNKELTWESSDSSIASINKNGHLVAKSAGKVTITATANDGSKTKGSIEITVNSSSGNVPASMVGTYSGVEGNYYNCTLVISDVTGNATFSIEDTVEEFVLTFASFDGKRTYLFNDENGGTFSMYLFDDGRVGVTYDDGTGSTWTAGGAWIENVEFNK